VGVRVGGGVGFVVGAFVGDKGGGTAVGGADIGGATVGDFV
jgi:hypothetical protein